jgi:ABC-2 type transport system ATP-binding protein
MLGLDVVTKVRIRQLTKHINQARGLTILFTTHDLSDAEKLCKRVTIIDHGKLLYDGKLDLLQERFGEKRQLIFDFAKEFESISIEGAIIADREGSKITVHFTGQDFTTTELINKISAQYHIRDLEVREPDFEATIRRIYKERLLEKLP